LAGLQRLGVDPRGVVVRAERRTSCKTRFSALNQQILRFDEEEVRPLDGSERAALVEAFRSAIDGADIVILSDYGKGVLLDGVAAELIAICRAAKKPVLVDPKSRDFSHYAGATAVTPNRKELGQAVGRAVFSDDEVAAAARELIAALVSNRRSPIRLPLREVQPKLKTTNFPVIVIRRDSNDLFLYAGAKLRHVFHVATGQSAYPTPLGHFQIVVKWENPWWYPPDSPWAKGAKPIPPGPGNPLGTRWMGLSAPGVGIHGTPDAASIGYSLSHGCIRMLIPYAEWLFNQVEIGTQVFIVAA
jgi:lipoprotein-anchoring transpeptidase ErfK/SrfK